MVVINFQIKKLKLTRNKLMEIRKTKKILVGKERSYVPIVS